MTDPRPVESLELNRLKTRFKDAAAERAFRRSHDREARGFIRLGLVTGLLGWLGGMAIVLMVLPQRTVLFMALVSVFEILLLGTFIATFSEKLLGRYQILVAACLVASGNLAVYMLLELGAYITVIALLVASLTGAFILRLRALPFLTATLLYVVPFQILLPLAYEVSSTDIAVLTTFLWMGQLSLTAGVVMTEGTLRKLFVKDRLIEQKTRELEDEHARSEGLLLNVLPPSIAARLKAGSENIADHFDGCTILFADLVGFTELSRTVTPSELVETLNRIFSAFDELTDKYGLEKIKTIGDAYMVAAGLPEPRADHARAVADFALEMLAALAKHDASGRLRMRVGINSGPVVAGVIGRKKFIYDLWGDSVNTASRMESHGLPGEIQVSHSTRELLRDTHALEARGVVEVKGKGAMEVFLLKGRLAEQVRPEA